MAESIKEQLEQDLKPAMREKDTVARETIRFTLAALKYAEIEKREALSPAEEFDVLKKQAKSRADSIEQFAAANRPDLVERESDQLAVLKRYMPTELSDADLATLVRTAVAESGATSAKEMGKVMPVAIKAAGDRVSGRRLSDAVKAALAELG